MDHNRHQNHQQQSIHRKRRKSNQCSNNHNRNGGNNSKSLLIRLSEACNRHKSFHETEQQKKRQRKQQQQQQQKGKQKEQESYSNQEEEEEEEEDHDMHDSDEYSCNHVDYETCVHELNILKGIIPKVEAAYRLPYKNCSIAGGTNTGNGNIHASDVFNLCMFYHNIVVGEFCPHSRQILLQNDSDGMDIFPRIHELFRYLASTQIIQNTIKVLTTSSSSTQEQPSSTTTADQISFTACILLQSLPTSSTATLSHHHHDLFHYIIVDLITLLFDLSTIASSQILWTMDDEDEDEDVDSAIVIDDDRYHDKNARGANVCNTKSSHEKDTNQQCIELLLFTQVLSVTSSSPSSMSSGNNDNVDDNDNDNMNNNGKSRSKDCNGGKDIEEYIVEIESIDELLSLQGGVFHLLFKLLVSQYTRRHSDEYIFEELIDTCEKSDAFTSTPTTTTLKKMGRNIDSSLYFAPYLAHNDVRSSLLACIRQVLETKMNSSISMENNDSSSFIQTTILSIRNKVFASNLLLLLLPDLSSFANEGDTTITSPLWYELMSLIINSVHAHYQFITTVLLPLLKHQKPNNHHKSHRHYKQPLSHLSASLSSMLGTLMSDIFICPLKPFNPPPYTMWSMRRKVICTLFDCVYHIDHSMNGSYHHLLSSSLSEAITDLSNVTLRAMQITFFPDVMIMERDSCDDNVNAEKRDKHVNEKGKDKRSSECDKEYEMMKLMIRDHCTMWNIFPALFSLLQNVSTMTLVISIIVHLPSCHYRYPTKEVLLVHACDAISTTKQRGDNRSESVSSKRRKISEKDPIANCHEASINMNEVAIDSIIDSNFTLALSNFLHLAVQDAKQMIKSSKGNLQMDHEIQFNHVEVGNIIGSIRLIHSFIGLDSYLEENTVSFQNKDVFAILSTLYEAGSIISEYISTTTQSKHVSGALSQHIVSLLDLSLRILTYEHLSTSSGREDTNTIIVQTRKSLISSIVKSALLHWSKMARLKESEDVLSIDKQANVMEVFNRSLLTFLDDTHIDHLQMLYEKSQCYCHEIHCNIESHIGMPYKRMKKCYCGFLSSMSCNSHFKNYCTGLLIEESYSLEQRCMYYACFHLNLSELDNDKKKATLSLFRDLYHNPSSRFSYFICIPNLLLSQIVKRFTESSTITGKKLMAQFINLLREVDFEENFIGFLSKQVQSDIRSHPSLHYQAFVCFTRVLSIYNFLTKISRSNIPNNIGSIWIFLSGIHSFERFECLDRVATQKKDSIFSFNFSTSLQDCEVAETYFTNLIIDTLNRVCYLPELTTDSFLLKRARWDLLSLSCNTLSSSKLHQFVSSTLPTVAMSDVMKPMQLLRWLFHSPFIDRDEKMRFYSCKKIGPLLLARDFKMLRILYGQDSNEFDLCVLVSNLFNDVDELLARHCGLMQSFFSLTMKTNSTCPTNSTWSSETEDTTINCSRQVSSILAISSLCGSADYDSQEGKLILQKGIMRLVRLWTTLSDTPSVFSSSSILHNHCNHIQVGLVAFNELVKLNHMGIFCQKMVERSEESFLPSLFAELLSRGIIEQSVYGKNGTSGCKDYEMLKKMIQTFFLKKSMLTCAEDNYENILEINNYFEKALPNVITGLILAQDYETLCSCTGFRIYLLSEIQRLEKKVRVQQKEKVMGMQYKKRLSEGKIIMNAKEIQNKTQLLCCSTRSNGSDGGVEILGRLLPALLMDPDKSPLLFYLKTVLRCKVTLGHLIKNNELKVIEAIFWELGKEDIEIDGDDFTISPKSWLEAKSSNTAVQGLKKGAIIMKKVNDEKIVLQANPNETIQSLEVLNSLDLNDPGTECSIEVEKWIHKHFMMLLVKCVTLKWKRGRMKFKIRAMNCLRVLIRFLRSSDCTQYITQVLTLIDSAMNCKHCEPDSAFTKSKLQLLAVRALAHFVHVLLSHQFEAVGQNLCQIVFSIFPLFESDTSITAEGHKTNDSDPFVDDAISQAVIMMESLSEGDSGRKLAPYFNDVPFLPKHPRLQHVRETLKRIGVNFDHSLLIFSELTCENAVKVKETPMSTASSSIDDKLSSYDNMMQVTLRQRLHCLKRLFNHENDNVRKIVLEHLTGLIRGNRELFHNLVKTEDASLQFLTIQSDHNFKVNGHSMKSFFDAILDRCIAETDMDMRLSLAKCLGEIGAIHPKYIGDDLTLQRACTLSNQWILENGAPWKSKSVKIHCQLQLVTKYFVAALKAAPTPTDQHLIGFAIQEVLKMLDKSASSSSKDESKASFNEDEKEMNPWLRDKLEEADVLSIIEPFWKSEYKQVESNRLKDPPFFKMSTSYFNWLSTWGRYMIENSYSNQRSRYNDLFYGCRSAIRSKAGIDILEFLLPLLILDVICFGDESEKDTTVRELIGVLSSSYDDELHGMEKIEVQKAVTVVFMVIETFQSWVDVEIEERFSSKRPGKSYPINKSANLDNTVENWPTDESIAVIESLLKAINLSLCAKAAANVGMFAQSLRYLEIEARKKNIDLYEAATSIDLDDESVNSNLINTKGIDFDLAHKLFGELNDYDSMNAISKYYTQQEIVEEIREKEANADWDGVLKLCEQVSQSRWLRSEKIPRVYSSITNDSIREEILRKSYLNALLELGQLDSALNQVRGMLPILSEGSTSLVQLNNERISLNSLIPYAVQASWRLSRWDSLDQLVSSLSSNKLDNTTVQKIDLEGHYNLALGRSMLALHKKDQVGVAESLKNARQAIIQSVSVASQESYNRAFPYLLKLHCLREIEDFNNFFCSTVSDNDTYDHFSNLVKTEWGWDTRLESVATNTAASIHITTMRLALARLSKNSVIEAELWLDAGKKARKDGLYYIAENCLSHAEILYQGLQTKNPTDNKSMPDNVVIRSSEVSFQLAKIKHALRKTTDALLMVKQDKFDALLRAKTEDIKQKAIGEIRKGGKLEILARNALQATEWMVESGLKSGSDVIARYKLINKMSPKWERAHYKFARYLNSVLDSRINVLASQTSGNTDDDSVKANIISKDAICQKYILNAMMQYGEALTLSQKHIFQALPRLLTLWFEFTEIEINEEVRNKQEEANEIMVKYVKGIPAISYYSVLPQLISRIGHDESDKVQVVCAILRRVLAKFPAQAMWHLGWLRHSGQKFSGNKNRKKRGEDIFKSAQKSLHRNEQMKMHDLLEASKGLFVFLIDLAKFQPKKAQQNVCKISQWNGNVELKEFMPPVQAALKVSLNAVGKAGSSESFPKCVPRMRSFSPQVFMMSSKARPKKLTAFAIPEGFKSRECNSRDSKKPLGGDIGEMHFLVKREARGDLRKDARVQDLNNVINRLLSSSSSDRNVGKPQHRRLQLRTFSVVCLSEDCGILEWVPKTDSLRNLVTSSYHPYTDHYSARRRGKRLTDFADVKLRGGFLKCQEQYLKHGNLTKATQMFHEFCLKEYPPLLYWWFLHKFQDPHHWFEARTKFALSSAAWSAVGHVIGLGDRHSENILVDTSSGDCVHVDFDCIFDKGLHLPRPEVVPFRLTPNMLDAFGPTGADGVFTGGLSASMQTLRDNKDVLLSVLEPFLKDPVIDWKGKQVDSNREYKEAKRSIRVIEQRLKGMYNLRNPNYRKIPRKCHADGHSMDDDEVARLLPLSVEGQVHKMITEASSHENLVQLYVGWMPWL